MPAAAFGTLVTDLLSADAVMLVGIVVLGVVIAPAHAPQGFANSMLPVLGSLYVVAAGLRETGAPLGWPLPRPGPQVDILRRRRPLPLERRCADLL